MSKPTTWLIANWKMNGDTARVRQWATAVEAALPATIGCVFCPPLPYLALAKPHLKTIQLGAQNCHAAANGAHTGEVSAPMLADTGCTHVIIGHSERRAAGETDADVIAKANAAISAGLTPIICIGESRAAYEAKQTASILDTQLKPISALKPGSYLIAYEPIWAIGTGLTPTCAEIAAAHSHIKSVLGSATCVLYGGSVNAGNIEEILKIAEVSGALIGGASLESESMCAMLASAAKIRGN